MKATTEKIKDPQPKDFGYYEGTYTEQGGWTLEGGEDAYWEAVKKYEASKGKQSIKVKTFLIHDEGDPSVGIFSQNWELHGDWEFEDAAELQEKKEAILDAFEIIEGERPSWVMTFDELAALNRYEVQCEAIANREIDEVEDWVRQNRIGTAMNPNYLH